MASGGGACPWNRARTLVFNNNNSFGKVLGGSGDSFKSPPAYLRISPLAGLRRGSAFDAERHVQGAGEEAAGEVDHAVAIAGGDNEGAAGLKHAPESRIRSLAGQPRLLQGVQNQRGGIHDGRDAERKHGAANRVPVDGGAHIADAGTGRDAPVGQLHGSRQTPSTATTSSALTPDAACRTRSAASMPVLPSTPGTSADSSQHPNASYSPARQAFRCRVTDRRAAVPGPTASGVI